MIPELGHLAMILALCFAVVQATVPLLGAWRGDKLWMSLAQPAAWGQFAFLLFSFGCLTYAFMADDFSVAYVASNSNTALPWYYKFSAVWGAHEGSLLLWAMILGGWTFAVSVFSRQLPQVMLARVLAIMGMISIGFLLFLILTSNPFVRLLPQIPSDGNDLNPLLQDIGLIVHPPMLYMGYVGFSVAFAFAIAALLGGRLDAAWARWSRPWTIVAWAFLGIGITLGSWWAYYELGWGGWWFWDPVENASFMPWLAGTALLHSLAVTEKRGVFKAWTVLLAIIAFALSLLGTFLVRSGVLTSVHAFASDPSRGLFVLGILAVVIGGSLTLFAVRAGALSSESRYELVSREMFLLANNLLLLTATTVVLLGTLFPLVADAMHLGKISVGPPYFNLLFVPLTLLLLFFLALGPQANWKRQDAGKLLKPHLLVLLGGMLLGVVLPLLWFGDINVRVAIACTLVFTVAIAIVRDVLAKVRTARAGAWAGLRRLSRSYVGMQLAHLGLLVTVLGVTLVSTHSMERDVRMAPGEAVTEGEYSFVFHGVSERKGANYMARRGDVEVLKNGSSIRHLYPEKRVYNVQRNTMTEAAIDPGLFRDLYVALGEPLEDGNSWAVRVYHKPFVRWLWLGALVMAAGGVLAATDRRYRMRKTTASALPVTGEKI
ncbi:heme lyase CcmF/NrfE family subunit [Pseudomonas sp.]|uniref:heme lyase CcmF/NrfE family subunit n=1 Tax=Pseudomonas sp. TaxID=306 RepID=UPI00262A5F34|nr:heme lyase CcmF/NrfE family subunit [Pseudomonas sp.]